MASHRYAELDVILGRAIYLGTAPHHQEAVAPGSDPVKARALQANSFFASPSDWFALLRSPQSAFTLVACACACINIQYAHFSN